MLATAADSAARTLFTVPSDVAKHSECVCTMCTQLPSALSEMQKLPSGQDQCAVALRTFAPSKGRPIRLHDNKCFTDDDGGRIRIT